MFKRRPDPSALLAGPMPAPLALCRRRWTAVFALPFAAMMGLTAVTALVMLPAALPGGLGWGLAVVCTGVCGALGFSVGASAWSAVFRPGPVLLIDARGIEDRLHLQALLPWRDIESFDLDYGHGHHLVLVLKPGAVAPGGKVVQRGWARSARRLFQGGDVTIPLAALSYHPYRLRDALAYHLARQQQRAGRQDEDGEELDSLPDAERR